MWQNMFTGFRPYFLLQKSRKCFPNCMRYVSLIVINKVRCILTWKGIVVLLCAYVVVFIVVGIVHQLFGTGNRRYKIKRYQLYP